MDLTVVANRKNSRVFYNVICFTKINVLVWVHSLDFFTGTTIKIFQPFIHTATVILILTKNTHHPHFYYLLFFCSFKMFSKSSKVLNSRKTLAKRM